MAEVYNMRGGEALRCIHSPKSPEGCGFAQECQQCQVKKTAIEAIEGRQTSRNRARVQLISDGKVRDLTLLVSAAPLNHNEERLAIVLLEDISELNSLRRRLNTEHSFSGIIGRDSKMRQLFETIRDVTDVNIPVLILGESGTGTELVASAIHNEGSRSQKPFVPVNCAALPGFYRRTAR